MRRLFAVVLCFLLLTTTAYAQNAASDVSSIGTATEDGSCQITMTVTIRLDETADSLVFPLGSKVSNVTLNGGKASLTRSGGLTCVKLGYLDGQEGSFTLTIQYTLKDLLSQEDGDLFITIPLLSGFKYPVEAMDFSITMPAAFDTVPSFYSGYYKQSIESNIDYEITGSTISGSILTALKDSETLVLELEAPEGMFIHDTAGETLGFDTVMMVLCGLLALIYWFKTMRFWPRYPGRRSLPPEGVSAGMLGSYLVHADADLTAMVVHWAQLGYLLIHVDDNGRVLLYQKMEMGNERSGFEQRCFRLLFRKGQMIDGTSYRYARLYEQVAGMSRRAAVGFERSSGNPKLFRILSCGVALFAGVAMADSVAANLTVRVVLMILLGIGSCVCCWHIQIGMGRLLLHDRTAALIGLGCCVLLLIAGNLCGALNYALIIAGWSLIAGLLGSYGGSRSENGIRIFGEILGLRQYMKKISKTELLRIVRSNPDYYYELAPYALALGVDRQFARRFEGIRQPVCTWLVTGMDGSRTAEEWSRLLREAVDGMNNLQKRPPWEKLNGRR